MVYQVGALRGFVTAIGGVLRHVKPHGALYNMAVRSRGLGGGRGDRRLANGPRTKSVWIVRE